MSEIVTLTINPAIDVAYSAAALSPTDKLRTPPHRMEPGGGGINVARVVVRLGGNARCIYFAGGPTGIAFDALLDQHQLVRHKVAIAGETRISTTIHEAASGLEYRLVPAGPDIAESEWQSCLDLIGAIECSYLVVSGSLPRCVPADFYARVSAIAGARGIRVVLDSSGQALQAGLAGGGLELIKPNLKEFEKLVGKSMPDLASIGLNASEIVKSGKARLVAVTLGDRGGVLASDKGAAVLPAPKVEAASAVGAGDSCVAAMVQALASGRSDRDAFRFGIAAGAAALLTPGTGLAEAHDIDRLYRQSLANDAFIDL